MPGIAFGNPSKANDECYTRRETVEYILDKYGYLMHGKKIILPCDTEESQIYKVMKERGYDCDIAQDMYGVDYSKYDLVFTNPPFHVIMKYMHFLHTNNIKFILFTPWVALANMQVRGILRPYKDEIYRLECNKATFDQPDGRTIIVVFNILTNLDEGKEYVTNSPDIRIEATDEWQHYYGINSDILNCNYLKYEYKLINSKLCVRLRKNY